jgi:hypothetical protein
MEKQRFAREEKNRSLNIMCQKFAFQTYRLRAQRAVARQGRFCPLRRRTGVRARSILGTLCVAR